ncbi:LexA family transcriptional regulator [Meridianimarinicoccus sp. RP-17]|uniref:LexA family transcriptional regulator n=1 Tax=Meridianimarinicoccus zhengii TaxID=2056810 RepID=UPI000DAC4DAA|nr:LexA family transcriptional regulator [Phycocomes zhengii]
MDMEQILVTIDQTLAEKGLSRAFVSEQATGSTSTLKNLWASLEAKRERRLGIENVKLIADFLGLEFYVGPPRYPSSNHAILNQLAERVAEFRTDRRIVPLDGLEPAPPISRLALPEEWFIDHGIAPSHAALVGQHDDAMLPSIPPGATVVIDTSIIDPGTAPGKIYALRIGSATLLRRCDPTNLGLVARPDNPAHAVNTILRQHLSNAPVLGRVRAVISGLD